jgi:hypothetical protein
MNEKLVKLEKQFGYVEFGGKKYILTDQASQSNRLFDGSWSNAEEGEIYTDEWKANALDEDENTFEVFWQWSMVKGQEPEDASNLPFDDENIVEVTEY